MIRELTSVRRRLNKNRNVDEAHCSQVTPTGVETLSTPQATTSDRDAMMTGPKEAMSCTKWGLNSLSLSQIYNLPGSPFSITVKTWVQV